MAELVWDQAGTRKYEAGIDRGVLYLKNAPGVAWSGLISILENPSGGDVSSHYLDGVKYLDIVASTDYQATINAYVAPPEFAACDGLFSLAPGLIATQQPRVQFGLSYRNLIGNDTEAETYGYKLHLVYNLVASPSQRENKTISNSPTATDMSWVVNAVPPYVVGYKPTAHFIIDSTLADPSNLALLEMALYGDSIEDAFLPDQDIVISIMGS